jgi:hypothetical protein
MSFDIDLSPLSQWRASAIRMARLPLEVPADEGDRSPAVVIPAWRLVQRGGRYANVSGSRVNEITLAPEISSPFASW